MRHTWDVVASPLPHRPDRAIFPYRGPEDPSREVSEVLHCLASELVSEIAMVADGDDYTLVLPPALREHAVIIDRLVSGIQTVGRDRRVARESVA